jgi:hypothetical protein
MLLFMGGNLELERNEKYFQMNFKFCKPTLLNLLY